MGENQKGQIFYWYKLAWFHAISGIFQLMPVLVFDREVGVAVHMLLCCPVNESCVKALPCLG